MRFFDRFRNRVKIPPFGVGIYGKLPGYKDFLFTSCSPAFSDWKILLDRGFDSLIRGGIPNPYVSPARRFFVDMKDQKVGLVGCIWDSSDGLRYFPFMVAMTLPRRYSQGSFSEFWQLLEQIWCYLEDLKQELEGYDSSTGILKRVRGENHKIEPFEPTKWEVKEHVLAEKARGEFERGMLSRIDLSQISALEELEVIHGLRLKRNPGFILWPITRWRDEHRGTTLAYLGSKGMGDLNIRFFPPVKDDPLLAKKGPTPNLEVPGSEQPSVSDSGSHLGTAVPRVRKPEPVPGLSEDHPMHPANQKAAPTGQSVARDEADTVPLRGRDSEPDAENTPTERMKAMDAQSLAAKRAERTGTPREGLPIMSPGGQPSPRIPEPVPMPPGREGEAPTPRAEPPRAEPPVKSPPNPAPPPSAAMPKPAEPPPRAMPKPSEPPSAATPNASEPPPRAMPQMGQSLPSGPPSGAPDQKPMMVLGNQQPSAPSEQQDDLDSTQPLDTVFEEPKTEPLLVEETVDQEPLREYSDWEVEEAQAQLEAAKSRKIPELHDDDIFDPNDSAGPLDLEGLGLKDP